MLISDSVMSQVPVPTPTKTSTLECGCGFHMGVGAGGPNFTHGLPVTSTIYWSDSALGFGKSPRKAKLYSANVNYEAELL